MDRNDTEQHETESEEGANAVRNHHEGQKFQQHELPRAGSHEDTGIETPVAQKRQHFDRGRPRAAECRRRQPE